MRVFVAVMLVVLCSLLLVSESGAWPMTRNGEWLDSIPEPYVNSAGQPIGNANQGTLLADGWAQATPEEIASRAEEIAAEQAEAEAMASLPTVFANGVATMDEDGHHIEHVATGSNQPVIAVQVSNSPLTQEQRKALKAAASAERAARKSARKSAEDEMFAAKNIGQFLPAFSNAWTLLLKDVGAE